MKSNLMSQSVCVKCTPKCRTKATVLVALLGNWYKLTKEKLTKLNFDYAIDCAI